MHVLINLEQMKTIAKIVNDHDINVSFAGNLVMAQEGEDVTITVAQDNNLMFWRVAADGSITEQNA